MVIVIVQLFSTRSERLFEQLQCWIDFGNNVFWDEANFSFYPCKVLIIYHGVTAVHPQRFAAIERSFSFFYRLITALRPRITTLLS
jgi:hypothetical protein